VSNIAQSILKLQEVSLTTNLGTNYLLQNISFEVNSGDRLAIIGASGAGKTSLLRLLNRLISPSQGTIFLENQEYSAIPVVKLRQQVVLVPQESKLLGMTVGDALIYPLKLQNLSTTEIKERLQTWIEKLKIPEDWLDRNELQLSVGQRQLVAIARGMMMKPKILLLDEPTSALDAGRSAYLLDILHQSIPLEHLTIIMVNHQLELAEKFANRVLYLDRGQVMSFQDADQVNWNQIREQLTFTEHKDQETWL
jgi:D-methionine transport system ATP-binding protein